jgi:hypothetical protein
LRGASTKNLFPNKNGITPRKEENSFLTAIDETAPRNRNSSSMASTMKAKKSGPTYNIDEP